MRQKLFRFLKSGDQFYTKDRDGKIHHWIRLGKSVNVHLSESHANVVNLKTGKFGLVYDNKAITYPSNFKVNKKPSAEKMSETPVYIY